MPEGGFDEIEIEERHWVKNFDDTQLADERARLETEYEKLNDDYLDSEMPRTVCVKYEDMDKIDQIKNEQDRRRKGEREEAEVTFDDNDDGKTVTIKSSH